MKIKKSYLLILSIPVFILISISAFAAESIWWITPGTGIGWVQVGVTDVRDLVKQFGEKGTWDKENGQFLYRENYGLDFLYDLKTAKVTSIMITKPSSGGVQYKTREGVNVSATMENVIKFYGSPTIMEKRGNYELATYEKGSNFTVYVSNHGRVVMIWLGMKSDYRKHIDTFRSQLK